MSYLGSDFTSGEITAIAWGWADQERVYCRALGEVETNEMLLQFVAFYNLADCVTGHYLKGHDLPMLNGALLEAGLPLLGPKLVSDTYSDLVKRRHLSGSQESLSGMLGLAEDKHSMSQTAWRAANRLTPEGIKLTRKRCIDDVLQHRALRKALLAAGALKPPKMWNP